MRGNLRPGTYRDRDGNLLHLSLSDEGYIIRHADGSVTAIGGTK